MSRKILFVDDEPEIRSLVATSLQEAGYEVLTAADASEAMSLAEGVGLGLIILDLNLAGESGFALMKFLQRNHPGVPVIIYTGEEHDYGQVQAIMQQGAHRYVQKGAIEALVEAVRSSFR
jgi:DNA-binding NtrC family response regulator